jgi:hypothetical protein
MPATKSRSGVSVPTPASSSWARARAALGRAHESSALADLGVQLSADGQIAEADRATVLERNIEALRAARGADDDVVSALLEAGRSSIAGTRLYRAHNDSVLLRDDASGAWSWVTDTEELAARAVGAMESERGGMHAPVIVCGCVPALGLLRVHRAVRSLDPEHLFRRGMLVVHEDVASLGAALTATDITGVIHDAGVRLFLGPGALASLEAWFAERPDDALPKRIVLVPSEIPGADESLTRRLSALVRERQAEQKRALDALVAENEARCADETLETARARLVEAALGRRALRVLICTSRHTTYTRYSVEGMHAALEAMGHEPRLLMERDGSSVHTGLSYARAVHEHRPDLIVVVNYPRCSTGGAIPRRIPYVMWVQDLMAHLFDRSVGASMDGWDVCVGAAPAQFWEDFGYPPESMLPYPTTACAHRFHNGEIEGERDERHDVDVAFVSHHSETPEAMARRLKGLFPPAAHAMLDALVADAREILQRALTVSPWKEAERAITRRFNESVGREPGPESRSTLMCQFMQPLMGRMFRHEAVGWAARICERRGWTLGLFGHGWERHPSLARYARGEAVHGEESRACYRTARAHLHIDLNTFTHQRVFECALSGGLPVMRAWSDALWPVRVHAFDELAQHASPVGTDERGEPVYDASDGAIARELQRELERMGLGRLERVGLPEGVTSGMIAGHPYARSVLLPPFNALRVLGGVQDVAFTDEASMERVLERAIEDPAWRRERSATMREGIERFATTEAFSRRVIEHAARVLGLRERLGEGAGACPSIDDIRASYSAWQRVLADG